MQCERCGRKPATFHLTFVGSGKTREKHLCESCVRPEDMPQVLPPESTVYPEELEAPSEAQAAELRCPSCGHVNQRSWNYCSACGSMREP